MRGGASFAGCEQAAAPAAEAAPGSDAAITPAALEAQLLGLLARCDRLKSRRPSIVGVGQMRRRLQKEVCAHIMNQVEHRCTHSSTALDCR